MMANFRVVNQYIKTNYPLYDIQAVRGEGYVYFIGEFVIESIYVNPASITTNDLADMVLEQIQDYLLSNGLTV